MKISLFLSSILLLVIGTGPLMADTHDVSLPSYITDNGNYDRNPSIIYDGSTYWLFYTKGDDVSTGGVRGPSYNPDADTYVVYYKNALSIEGLAGTAETKLTLSETGRPANFSQRVVSAAYFKGDIYAFVSSGQDGINRGLYYYQFDGSSWSGPTELISDATARGGHVNVTCDNNRVYIVWESSDGSSDCYTWDGTSLSSKVDISGGNQPKITLLSGRLGVLYVVNIEDGTGDIEVFQAATDPQPAFGSHSTAIPGGGFYDPCIFNDGTNLYVISAPWVAADRQYLVQTKSVGTSSAWAAAKTVSYGGYGGAEWWDYWPCGFYDGSDAWIFFTSETDNGPVYGNGEIACIKMEWDLSRNHYFFIQNAVDQATSGDEVNILAGTYPAVDRALAIIDKSLTLTGAGQTDDASGTILYGSTYGAGQDATGLGTGWPRAIVVQADDITIRNMRIKGYQGDQVAVGGYAVVARASSSWGVTDPTIDRLLAENITLDDCYYGFRAQNVTDMTVQQTTYEINSGVASYAVYVNTSTNTTIRANDYTGGAIWVTDATGGVIGGTDPSDGNNLTDIVYNGIWYGQQFAAGTSSEDGLIQNNSINGAGEGGIVVWNWPGEVADNIRILDNYVTGAAGGSDEHGGISIYQGDFTNLLISGNVSTSNADNQPGLLLSSNTLTSAVISNNEFTYNPVEGIKLAGVTRGNATITENKVEGNSTGMTMTGGTTTTLDAGGNWWGSNDPTYVAGEVAASIDYTPWLNDGTDTEPSTPGFQPDLSIVWVDDDSPQSGTTGRIQEGINLVVGSTVNVVAGIYNESIVFESTFDKDGLIISGDDVDRPIVANGVRFLQTAQIDGITFENLYIKGLAPGANAIFDMDNSGQVNDFAMDNCVLDGENISGQICFGGQNLSQSFTVTNTEFMNVLGWALMDIESGSGDGGSNLPFTTVTFSGNHIHECNGSVALRGNSSDQTDLVNISGNVFENIGGNQSEQGQHWAAFEVNHADAANIFDNTVDNVAEGEWTEGQAVQLWDVGTLDMYNNAITNCHQGVFVFGGSSGGTYGGPYAIPGGSMHSNTFSGNSQYNVSVDAAATGTALNAENNYWGVMDCSSVSAMIDGNVDFDPWCNYDFSYCSFTCGDIFEVWVDDDWAGSAEGEEVESGKYFNFNAFASIQDAVDVVAATGQVHVASGLYGEQVAIDKSLSIDGTDNSVIEPPLSGLQAFTLEESSNTFYPILIAYGGDNDGSNYISGTATIDVSISGFDIDGNNSAIADMFVGILLRNCTASEVSGNNLYELLAASGNPRTGGIMTYGNSEVTISGNTVNDWSRGGIVVIGDGGGLADPTAVITGNNVAGEGPLPEGSWAQNGIQISIGATGSIIGNEVSDIAYIPTSWAASAINISESGIGVTVKGNNVHDCEAALYCTYVDDILINENNIFNNNEFIMILGGDNITFDGNTLTNNVMAFYIGDAANVSVSNNQFTGNDYGILADGSAAHLTYTGNVITTSTQTAIYLDEYYGYEPADVVIFDNSISGNAYGIYNLTTVLTDASANWWGDASGPAIGTRASVTTGSRPAPALGFGADMTPIKTARATSSITNTDKPVTGQRGSGDAVSDNVDYTPWLADGADIGGEAGFQGDLSSLWVDDDSPQSGATGRVQEGINLAEGSTVNVAAGTYNETVDIKKAITLLGAGASTTFIDGSGLDAKPLVKVTADDGNVTFDGFTVQNGASSDGSHFQIILYNGNPGDIVTISNCIIIGCGDDSNDDYGLYTHGGLSDLVFTYNTVSNCASHGVFFERYKGATDISYNNFVSLAVAGPVVGFMTYENPSDPAGSHDVTSKQWVHNNDIDANGGSGVMFIAPFGWSYNQYKGGSFTNVEISDNVIHKVGDNSKGIQLEVDGDGGGIYDAVISGNTVTAQNPQGGTSRGIRILAGAVNTSITDNTITDFYRGVYQSYSWGQPGAVGPTGTILRDNTITGCTFAVDNQYTDPANGVDAESNYWGAISCIDISAMMNGAVDFDPWCNSDFSFCGFTCNLLEVWVDDDYCDACPNGGHYWGYDAFDIIDDGVHAVADGGIVHVFDGNYTLPIDIDGRSNVTIAGESELGTIYKPESTIGWNVASYGTSRQVAIRVVGSSGITLSSMTMDFDIIKGDNKFGLLFWNSGGEISDNTIQNMNTSGYYEIVSYIRAPDYTDTERAQIDILNNTFLKTGRLGVCTHDYVNVLIEGNTFDKVDDDFGYAIELGSMSTGIIRGNTFTNYDTWAATDQSSSAAMYIENSFTWTIVDPMSKPVLIEDNDISYCQYGIFMGNEFSGYSGDVDIDATISDNTIRNNSTAGSQSSGGILITDEGKDVGSSVTAVITGNEIENNGDYGIYVYTAGNGDVTMTLTDNLIKDNYNGTVVKDFGSPSTSAYNLDIYRNMFSNNLNAEDDVAGGFWDDGVSVGNCWNDFASNSGYPTQYNISGNAGTVDRYPNVDCGQYCDCEPGEANGEAPMNILDIVYIINFVYKEGPAPTPYPLCNADPDCDCKTNILDIVYLINAIYKDGPAPCSCSDWVLSCDLPLRSATPTPAPMTTANSTTPNKIHPVSSYR